MPGAATLSVQLLDAVRDLRAAHATLDVAARKKADAERAYRRAKAIAYLRAEGKTVPEREALAEAVLITSPDGTTLPLADWRYARDLADGERDSALEAVRSNRQIVSAMQSLAGLERSELELVRFGPQEDP